MVRIAVALLSILAAPALCEVTAPGGRVIDCYCTDSRGARVEMGQSICLTVDGRMITAQCQMSLNVPMWREISAGCLSSGLSPAQGVGDGAEPALDPGPVHPQI